MESIKYTLEVVSNFKKLLEDIRRIKEEADFSLVVDEGIAHIRAAQRRAAPIGKTGPGPHGRIPKSIQQSNVLQQGDTWKASTHTNYGPAIFTNVGTKKKYMMWHGGKHPGLEAGHWWEAGSSLGANLAEKAFKDKVERMLRVGV